MIIIQPGDKLPALNAIPGDVPDWVIAPMTPTPDPLQVVRPHLGDPLPKPQPDEAIIVTGSAAMVTDHSQWIADTRDWMLDALERDCYLLAICFGHQLLAQALGGTVGNNPFGGEVGTVCSTLNRAGCRDTLLGVAAGVTAPDQQASLWVQTAHSQSVLKLPERAELLASSALDPHHAYRIGNRAWGIQFHPEFSAQVTAAFVRDAGDSVQRRGETTVGLLAGIRDSEVSPRLLARFADIARPSPTAGRPNAQH